MVTKRLVAIVGVCVGVLAGLWFMRFKDVSSQSAMRMKPIEPMAEMCSTSEVRYFSTAGKNEIAILTDESVEVWDFRRGSRLFQVNQGRGSGLFFTNGRLCCVAGDQLVAWNAERKEELYSVSAGDFLGASGDGIWATRDPAGGESLLLFDLSGDKNKLIRRIGVNCLRGATLSGQGLLLFSDLGDERAKLLRPPYDKSAEVLDNGRDILKLGPFVDEKRVFITYKDNSFSLWDIQSRTEKLSMHFAINDDDELVLFEFVGDDGKGTRILDPKQLDLTGCYALHLQLSPDMRTVAVAGVYDRTGQVVMVDIIDCREQYRFTAHKPGLIQMCFVDSGRFLVTRSLAERGVKVWDLERLKNTSRKLQRNKCDSNVMNPT